MTRADLPVTQPDDVREAKSQRAPQQNVKASKEDSKSVLNPQGNRAVATNATQTQTVTAPIKSEKLIGRNDKVSVQYMDGTVKKDVKFKTVEEDIKNKKCILLEE